MSSLFSCFGKKGASKKTGKEPKDKKNKRKSKSNENENTEELLPKQEEQISDTQNIETVGVISIPDIIEEHGTKEPQSPLIKELEEKLLERKEKGKDESLSDPDKLEVDTADDSQDTDRQEDKEVIHEVPAKEGVQEEGDKTIVNENTEESQKGVTGEVEEISRSLKDEKIEIKEHVVQHVMTSQLSSSSYKSEYSFDTELEQMKKDFEYTKEENVKLRDFISKLEREATKDVKDMRDQIENLQTKINDLERTNSVLKEREVKMGVEMENLKEEKQNTKTQNDGEVRMVHAIKDRENILSAFEQLSKMCMFLEPRLDKIENLHLNNNNNKKKDAIVELGKVQEDHSNIKENVNEMVKSVQRLECRIIRLEIDKDNLEENDKAKKEIDDFARRLQDMEKENGRLNGEMLKMKDSVDKKSSTIDRLEREKGSMSSQVYAFMSDLEKYKCKVDDLQMSVKEKETELENAIRTREMAQEELKLQSIKMQTMVAELKSKDELCSKTETKLKELNTKHSEVVKRLQENTQQKQNGSSSKPVLVMEIQNDCSGIMRISERFQRELYEGQWKEAFDKLTNTCRRDEKKSLQILMDFCTEAYLHCRRIARQQLDTVCSLLQNPSASHHRGSISRRAGSAVSTSILSCLQKHVPTDRLPEPLRHHLLDFRKTPSKEFVDNVYDDFLNQLDFQKSRHLRSFHMKEVNEITPYINKCLEISWEMVVQDPPMYLQFKVRHGTEIDTEKFSFYSRPGHVVDYLVWPALLREENGAILQKGFVQAVSPKP